MYRLIIMISLLAYAGFKTNSINGIFDNFKTIGITVWELLKLTNIISFAITNDGILTNFFKYYIVYFLVGLLFEIFNIKKGDFGKIFGKMSYWILGIPVSALLNIISNLLLS